MLDTNILIRFFTGDPPDQAQQTHSLIAAADRGQITLILLPIIVAETVFTLQSYYKMNPKDIASRFVLLVQSSGIQALEKDRILDAFQRYGDRKAGFVDAYISAAAIEEDLPIASFDHDFDKFKGINRIEPTDRY